jgi:hypothetical protein
MDHAVHAFKIKMFTFSFWNSHEKNRGETKGIVEPKMICSAEESFLKV